jgi:hypothetical protein
MIELPKIKNIAVAESPPTKKDRWAVLYVDVLKVN